MQIDNTAHAIEKGIINQSAGFHVPTATTLAKKSITKATHTIATPTSVTQKLAWYFFIDWPQADIRNEIGNRSQVHLPTAKSKT